MTNNKDTNGYWIVQGGEIKDQAAFEEYGKLWQPVAKKFGAEMIAHSETADVVEGRGPQRIVVIKFPSFKHATEAYHSPEYSKAAHFGRLAGERSVTVLPGIPL